MENLRLKIHSAGGPGEFDMPREQEGVVNWYKEQVRRLPEMRVRKTTLTNGVDWLAQMTLEGLVGEVTNTRGFFSIEGAEVTRADSMVGGKDFSWTQPYIKQTTEKVTAIEGEEILLTGVVLLMMDHDGRVFLSVEQEPFAQEQIIDGKTKRPVVRSPFQTSFGKLNRIYNGETEVDQRLADIINELGGKSVLQKLELQTAPTDSNRIDSNVAYGVLIVNNGTADFIKNQIPNGRFLNNREVNMLGRMNALNAHTRTALHVAETLSYT